MCLPVSRRQPRSRRGIAGRRVDRLLGSSNGCCGGRSRIRIGIRGRVGGPLACPRVVVVVVVVVVGCVAGPPSGPRPRGSSGSGGLGGVVCVGGQLLALLRGHGGVDLLQHGRAAVLRGAFPSARVGVRGGGRSGRGCLAAAAVVVVASSWGSLGGLLPSAPAALLDSRRHGRGRGGLRAALLVLLRRIQRPATGGLRAGARAVLSRRSARCWARATLTFRSLCLCLRGLRGRHGGVHGGCGLHRSSYVCADFRAVLT